MILRVENLRSNNKQVGNVIKFSGSLSFYSDYPPTLEKKATRQDVYNFHRKSSSNNLQQPQLRVDLILFSTIIQYYRIPFLISHKYWTYNFVPSDSRNLQCRECCAKEIKSTRTKENYVHLKCV